MVKKLRRILTILIVAAMCTALPACSSKKETSEESDMQYADTEETDTPAIVVGQAEARAGDVVTVPINIVKSPGIAACRLLVEYDAESLELQAYAYGESFAEGGEDPAELTSPVVFTWSQLENVTGDVLFAELEFKIRADAQSGMTVPINIRYTEYDLIDIDENKVDFVVENGSVYIEK